MFFLLLHLSNRETHLGCAQGLYTALIITLNTIATGGGSNLYPPELAGTFSEQEIRERIYGSKIVIVSEQAMLNVIYVLKTCMLIMVSQREREKTGNRTIPRS